MAARAGVSRATASRVVNNLDRVAPHVVESVQAAIRELGYVPNQAARSLARRRTGVVAVVIPESTERLFADPFFAAVIQGASDHLATTDYTLNLAIGSNESEKSRRYLTGGNVDGVLVISQHDDDLPVTQLGLAVPIVFAGRPALDVDERGCYVDVDNRGATAAAVRHLIDLGRTKIATIAGAQDLRAGRDRLQGWRDALSAAGLAANRLAEGDFTPESGTLAMEKLLAGPELDAVFAANDQMAFGAISAIVRTGRTVPGDVAVVGFDDDQFSRAARPTITTVHQPAREMGQVMARHLLALMNGETVEPVTLLPTELVVRESSWTTDSTTTPTP
ncbi:MAG TPA: LacI family DNA-binding transcriptional regulator [Microlunatus sp.]|nr:LacI family DNA-binding transcriptional regulator [Microlunatus sp.]